MQYARQNIAEERQSAYTARSKKARRWARLVLWLVVGVFLTAVWQNRALAPQVHDGMVKVAGNVQYAMENTDDVRAYVHSVLSRPSGTSVQAEFDPITTWLIKWKN